MRMQRTGARSAISSSAWAFAWVPAWICACATTWALAGSVASAQMPIGSVSTLDATVTGASSVANDRAQLGTNGTVIAKDHVAFVSLLRGGSLKVCATSGVHLTAGTALPASSAAPASTLPGSEAASSAASPSAPGTDLEAPEAGAAASGTPATAATTSAPLTSAPLMVALDRGAMELRMGTVPGDIVMTPDLRFSFNGDGQLDVRIRVTRNGDTCIENRVAGLLGHPGLKVGSLFGSESYDVLPGQHVLFEGGNLHEVVDNESSPCGCPEEAVKPPPVAEVVTRKGVKITGTEAAAQHPFPADVSQGLAPSPPVPQAAPQVTHTQVATTLVYTGDGADTASKKDTPAMMPAPVGKKGFFHGLGKFFRKVF